MKARKVKGLDPDAPLADEAERIIRARVAELCSFVPRAFAPGQDRALHDMRIAAKRLRYVLELTGFCFGPYARKAAEHARALQDLIGEIHDCDVMGPRVGAQIDTLREQDTVALRTLGGEQDDLAPGVAARAPNRSAYRGLEVLYAYLGARRALLFDRLLELWATLESEQFSSRLEQALAQRAPGPAAPTPTQAS